MSNRNDILAEMQSRLKRASIRSVRNPSSPPSPSDYPIVSIITSPSSFFHQDKSGGFPEIAMAWAVTVVPYIIGSDGTDETAEDEIEDYIITVLTAIYGKIEPTDEGDNNLGGLCHRVAVKAIGDLLKPYSGEVGIGVQIDLEIIHSLFG